MTADDFCNHMKAYEATETARKLDPHLSIYARIDGRAFSTFTHDMARMTLCVIARRSADVYRPANHYSNGTLEKLVIWPPS
ncbi:MAG TPA: hypothetical protein VKC66_20335 [Xanthobacteraceae bacterium]|nr:hypothetical protein [Xanthobacteraceae bacterium]